MLKGFGDRLKNARKKKELSQGDLAERLDLKRNTISNYETETSNPSLIDLKKIVDILDVSYSYLIEGKEDKIYGHPFEDNYGHLNVKDPYETYKNKVTYKIKPVVITTDQNQNENITFIPVKAQAGYLSNHENPEYIREMPSFAIPGLKNGIFRAFEVEGYSMLQFEGAGLYPSDIVIAEYVENIINIRDLRVYVVICTEGILIKRCINRLESSGKLICNSDNRNGNYPPYVLNYEDIYEVWEFKARISRQLPYASDVYDKINDMSAEIAILRDELDKLKKKD